MRIERLILALATLTATGGIGTAAHAIDPLDAIGVCARINKKDARLECYDQVAQDAASGRLQSNAPAAAPRSWDAPPVGGAVARPQAPAAPSASFGGENLRASPSPSAAAPAGPGVQQNGPDEIRAEVASSTDNGLLQWRVMLADGAVWQMTERAGAGFRPPAPREVVTIRKGALGSFLMEVGQQPSVRVRRVR